MRSTETLRRLPWRTRKYLFDRRWDRLAKQGRADERGSVEYSRLFREWTAAGSPVPIRPWLTRQLDVLF